MDQEKYNLNWHNYSDHLRTMLHDMMKSNELTDVTLVCDDKIQFKAHKIVLSACSPVFKTILNNLQQSSAVIYLRGIKCQEMESILEFMYLGSTTFCQDSIEEFLDVAKNLEIKEISQTVEFNEEDHESKPTTFATDDKYECKNENYIEPESNTKQNTPTDKKIKSEGKNQKFGCDMCDSQFTSRLGLKYHFQSKHQSKIFPCNLCDNQYTQQRILKRHILSKHQGLKYDCDHCENQFNDRSNLIRHIQMKHDSFTFHCEICDYQTPQKSYLTRHIQKRHATDPLESPQN